MPAARKTPVVCYVTDSRGLNAEAPVEALAEKIRMAVSAGADWLQIREKHLAAKTLLALAKDAVSLGGARVFVNDRLDVALAGGAAGVHLGHESAPAADVVRWCRASHAPEGFWVGVSCHSLKEVRQAEREGAAYAFFGPVFNTPSKRPYGEPQGLERLGEACRAVRIPVIAIGGIDEENARLCLVAGAAGIAAIRFFQESADACELREKIAFVR